MGDKRYLSTSGSFRVNLPVGERMRAETKFPAGAWRLALDVMVYNGAVLLRMISANRGVTLPYYRVLGPDRSYERHVETTGLILTNGAGNCRLVLPRSWQDSGVDLLFVAEERWRNESVAAIADVQWLMDIDEPPSAIDQLASIAEDHGER